MRERSTAVSRRKRIPAADLHATAARHRFEAAGGVTVAVLVCYQVWRFVFGRRFDSGLLLTLIATGAAVLLLPKAASWAQQHRHFRLALWFSPRPWRRQWFRFQTAVARDDVPRALALSEGLVRAPGTDVLIWNSIVNLFIATGRYREAIRYRGRFDGRLRDARELLPHLYGLVLLNLAEAQYNLGRWKRAKQLMVALRTSGMMNDALNHTGGYAQLAWIAAHDGDGKAALEALGRCNESGLPPNFRAELHFTYAAAHLANHDIPQARQALEQARARLIRPSSARNLLFLEARCCFTEGNFRQAATLCEQAANHAFKGQGGDGLLLWGDACEKLGDSAAAARAWQLAIDRDGESESAMLAKARLEAATRKSA